VPRRREPWVNRLDLREESLRVLGDAWGSLDRPPGDGGRHRQRRAPAGVVDENPARARLPARDLPRVLIAGVREGRAGADAWPTTLLVPESASELRLQLAISTAPELLNRGVLQGVEPRARVVQVSQNGER